VCSDGSGVSAWMDVAHHGVYVETLSLWDFIILVASLPSTRGFVRSTCLCWPGFQEQAYLGILRFDGACHSLHFASNHPQKRITSVLGFFWIRLGKVAGNTAIPRQGVGRLVTRRVGCAIWSLVRC